MNVFLIKFNPPNKQPRMLEFSKKILQKVSFDKLLFEKELRKALKWIKKEEDKLALKTWALATFGVMYSDVILKVYQGMGK